jgi:hypothetical protein
MAKVVALEGMDQDQAVKDADHAEDPAVKAPDQWDQVTAVAECGVKDHPQSTTKTHRYNKPKLTYFSPASTSAMFSAWSLTRL